MMEVGDNQRSQVSFFFPYGKDAFKLIPKCGSTSVRQHLRLTEFSLKTSVQDFRERERRILVVRHPLDRLRSAVTAFGTKDFREDQMAAFLRLLRETPDEERNWHWQSVAYQIARVRDAITHVVRLEQWAKYDFLPVLPSRRLNLSNPRMSANIRHWTPEESEILRELYREDFQIWEEE